MLRPDAELGEGLDTCAIGQRRGERIVPALRLLLKPPPLGCAGGVSSVVPWTVTIEVPVPHGARSTVTTTAVDVLGLRSAMPLGAGKVVISITLKRSRVTAAPVGLTWLGYPLTEERVSRFLSWLESIPAYTLTYGSLDEATEQIATLSHVLRNPAAQV